MHRRIDVAKLPLIGGNLAVGMHIPIAQKEQQLLFGKMGVEAGKGQHVKSAVPGGVPRVFPFVGHGDDVAVEEVPPVEIALLAGSGGAAFVRLPIGDDIVVKLFAPEQAGIGLARNIFFLISQIGGN